MCRTSGIGRRLPVLVCCVDPPRGLFLNGKESKQMLMVRATIGSGCIAALEAEKFLAEREDEDVANGIEGETQAEKSQSNGAVPEYRSNPLL